jgi:hypothetical protein
MGVFGWLAITSGTSKPGKVTAVTIGSWTWLLTFPRELLERATDAYNEREYFLPERARVAYKKWQMAVAFADMDTGIHAQEATDLYRKLHGTQPYIAELKDEDFDKSIVFWSR